MSRFPAKKQPSQKQTGKKQAQQYTSKSESLNKAEGFALDAPLSRSGITSNTTQPAALPAPNIPQAFYAAQSFSSTQTPLSLTPKDSETTFVPPQEGLQQRTTEQTLTSNRHLFDSGGVEGDEPPLYYTQAGEAGKVSIYAGASLAKEIAWVGNGIRLLNVSKHEKAYRADLFVNGKVVSGYIAAHQVIDLSTSSQTLTLDVKAQVDENIKKIGEGDPTGIAAIAYLSATLGITKKQAQEYYKKKGNIWRRFSAHKVDEGGVLAFSITIPLKRYLKRLQKFHGALAVDLFMQRLKLSKQANNPQGTDIGAVVRRSLTSLKTPDLTMSFNAIYPQFIEYQEILNQWKNEFIDPAKYRTMGHWQKELMAINGDEKLKNSLKGSLKKRYYPNLKGFLKTSTGTLPLETTRLKPAHIAKIATLLQFREYKKNNIEPQASQEQVVNALLTAYQQVQLKALEPGLIDSLNQSTTSVELNYQQLAMNKYGDAHAIAKQELGKDFYQIWIEASNSAFQLAALRDGASPRIKFALLRKIQAFYLTFRQATISLDGILKDSAIKDTGKFYPVSNQLNGSHIFSNQEFIDSLKSLGYTIRQLHSKATNQNASTYFNKKSLERLVGTNPSGEMVKAVNPTKISQRFFEVETFLIRYITQKGKGKVKATDQGTKLTATQKAAMRLEYTTRALARVSYLKKKKGAIRVPVSFVPEVTTKKADPKANNDQLINQGIFSFEWYAYQKGAEWILNTPKATGQGTEEYQGKTIKEAIDAYVKKQQDQLPKGVLYYQLPNGQGGRETYFRKLAPDTSWKLKDWAKAIGFGSVVLGILLSPFGVGEVLFLVGNIAQVVDGSLSIRDDIKKGTLKPLKFTLDLLGIASGIVGGSMVKGARSVYATEKSLKGLSKAARLRKIGKLPSATKKYIKLIEANVALNTTNFMVYSADLAQTIKEINDNSKLLPGQKKALIVKLLLFYAGTSFLSFYSHSSDTKELNKVSGVSQPRARRTPGIEPGISVRSGRTEPGTGRTRTERGTSVRGGTRTDPGTRVSKRTNVGTGKRNRMQPGKKSAKRTHTNSIVNSGVAEDVPFNLPVKNVYLPEESFEARLNNRLEMEINIPRLKQIAEEKGIPFEVLLKQVKAEEYGHVWAELLDRMDSGVIAGLRKEITQEAGFAKIKKAYGSVAKEEARKAAKVKGEKFDEAAYIEHYLAKEFIAQAIRGKVEASESLRQKIWRYIREVLEKLGIHIGKNKTLSELSLADLIALAKKDTKGQVTAETQDALLKFLKGETNTLAFNPRSVFHGQHASGDPLVIHNWYGLNSGEFQHKLIALIDDFKASPAFQQLKPMSKSSIELDRIHNSLIRLDNELAKLQISRKKISQSDIAKIEIKQKAVRQLGKDLKALGNKLHFPDVVPLRQHHDSKYVIEIDKIDETHDDLKIKGEFGELVRTKLYEGTWSTQTKAWVRGLFTKDFGKGGILDPSDKTRFISTHSDEFDHITESGAIPMTIPGHKGTVYSIPIMLNGTKNYQIDHILSVAKHWQGIGISPAGHNTDQISRATWYQTRSNLRIISKSLNAALGSGGVNYINKVGPNFKGPGE